MNKKGIVGKAAWNAAVNARTMKNQRRVIPKENPVKIESQAHVSQPRAVFLIVTVE